LMTAIPRAPTTKTLGASLAPYDPPVFCRPWPSRAEIMPASGRGAQAPSHATLIAHHEPGASPPGANRAAMAETVVGHQARCGPQSGQGGSR
jgi:hypothetical protein